jgi:DNA processing protein
MPPSTRGRPDPRERAARYLPPARQVSITLSELLKRCNRPELQTAQFDLLRRGETTSGRDVLVHYAGDLDILNVPCVSIVGTREVSDEGRLRASRLARELTAAGAVVVSGLAKGVDHAAHSGAIENGGRTVAVIGTPLDKAYPAENAALQERIYREHLLISPFAVGEPVFKSNFPARNRVMAALSDATVIVEASDTSGTLHQAAECQRLGRWLFIMRSVAEDRSLKWPASFLGKPQVSVLSSTAELLHEIRRT